MKNTRENAEKFHWEYEKKNSPNWLEGEKQYEESLEIVKMYKENLLSNSLKEFKKSEIIEKYFTGLDETTEKILHQISDLINKDININDIINILLEKSYTFHLKFHNRSNGVDVENKLKVLIKELLNKYEIEDYYFINNKYLDHYLELFLYLLNKDNKILKSIDVKTVIRLRDYIGSNLHFTSQSKYLNVYIFLIRRLDNSFLLNMGNRFVNEYEAFKKCYEFL